MDSESLRSLRQCPHVCVYFGNHILFLFIFCPHVNGILDHWILRFWRTPARVKTFRNFVSATTWGQEKLSFCFGASKIFIFISLAFISFLDVRLCAMLLFVSFWLANISISLGFMDIAKCCFGILLMELEYRDVFENKLEKIHVFKDIHVHVDVD